MGLKSGKPKSKIFLQNSTYKIMPNLWNSFWNKKNGDRIMIICLSIYEETKTVQTNLIPETVHYISFSSKFI